MITDLIFCGKGWPVKWRGSGSGVLDRQVPPLFPDVIISPAPYVFPNFSRIHLLLIQRMMAMMRISPPAITG